MNMLSYQLTEFGKPLQQVIREVQQPQGSEVALRTTACGVCHSDVHLHDGYFDLGGGNKLDVTRTLNPPRVLGHEIVGEVIAVGPDVTSVKIGDKRVAFPWIGCGKCSLCASGLEHLCNKPGALGLHRDGGFSSHVLVPHDRYLVAYGDLAAEQACTYACAGLTAYSALKKVAPITAENPLLIIGAGGVGLSGIRLAKQLFGVGPIVAEIDKSKWDLAKEAGASDVIDPTAEGAAKALFKATGGVAAVIDFVGAGSSFNFGQSALRKGGKIVCVGLIGGESTVVPAMISMKAITIQGSYVGSLREMNELMEIARSGVLPDLPLSSQPLSTVTDALADLRAGKIRGRTIVRP